MSREKHSGTAYDRIEDVEKKLRDAIRVLRGKTEDRSDKAIAEIEAASALLLKVKTTINEAVVELAGQGWTPRAGGRGTRNLG